MIAEYVRQAKDVYATAALDVADLRQHEAEMNAALASAIPKDIWRSGLKVTIDLHDEPFYGKGLALRTYTCQAQTKATFPRLGCTPGVLKVCSQCRLSLTRDPVWSAWASATVFTPFSMACRLACTSWSCWQAGHCSRLWHTPCGLSR